MSRARLHRHLAWALVAALALFAYAGALDAPFVYDDKIEVIGNRTIRSLEEWRAVAGYNWNRVLLVLTYAWDFRRHGLEPRGYHVTSLALFVLVLGAALSAVEAAARLARHRAPLGVAAAAVALWAVHPMGTEAVTYITGRSEVLAALFWLLALGSWARALCVEREGSGGAGWRSAGLLATAGAALTKETAFALPLALFWTEWRLGGRRVRWRWFLPMAALAAGAALLRIEHQGVLLPREVDRPLGVQLVTSAWVWVRYAQLWLAPVGQTIFHHQPDLAPLSWRGALAVGSWVALVGAGVAWGRRVPLAGWALGVAALSLVPSTSVVPLKEHMAEHRAFLAGLGLLVAIAASVPARWGRAGAGAAAAATLALLLATRARNAGPWSSEAALWEEATRRNPEVADAWYGLGDALRFSGRWEEAAAAYRRATSLDPGHLDAWNNLGIALAERGDAEGARQAWRAALQRSPSYCKAHNNLGSLAYRRRDWDEAIVELRSALAYCPDSVVAHYLLGNIYYGPRRDAERARVHYEAVVDLDPHFEFIDEVRERLLELTW